MKSFYVYVFLFLIAIFSILQSIASDDNAKMTHSGRDPVWDEIYATAGKIGDAYKKSDYESLHLLLKKLKQERNQSNWLYVYKLNACLNRINGIDVMKASKDVRSDIVRLCDSAISKKPDDSIGLMVNQQLSISELLLTLDFQYNAKTKIINGTLSQTRRKKRVIQLLNIWKNMDEMLDKEWTLDSENPRESLAKCVGAYQAFVSITVDNATEGIKDEDEKK